MGLTIESEDTLTTTPGTEQQLAAPTTSALRTVRLDLNALANSEVVHLRIKSKVRSAGTIRDQHYLSYLGPVGNLEIEPPPVTTDLGATFTLTQIGGSARSIDWKILTFGAAPVVENENTQACTVGTPVTIFAPTTNKTRVLRLDLSPLIAVTNAPPESLRIQIQTKTRAAGTIRNQYDIAYTGAAPGTGTPILESVPVSGDLGATFTITQLNGTNRSVDWKVLTLD